MTITETIAQVEAETDAISTNRPVNGAFSQLTPLLQLYWDSTSYGALETCPQYYKYSIIDGLVPRGTVKVDLFFGQEYQFARETYDRRRAAGAGHEAALTEAVRLALIRTWNFETSRPWVSDNPMKNRLTLIRAIVWYHDQFANDDLETIIRADGEPMVEQSFRFDTGVRTISGDDAWCPNCNGDGHVEREQSEDPDDPIVPCTLCDGTGLIPKEPFYLCGHLDRVAQSRTTGRKAIVDHKTTRGAIGDRYFERYSPDTQVSIYDIAGEVVLHEKVPDFIIDAAQLGVNFVRFQRGNINRTAAQREEWLQVFSVRMVEAEIYARNGLWPQNAKACSAYSSYQEDFDRWKGGCPFRGVCGSDPNVRPAMLKGMFEHRTWDPTKPR